MLFSRILAVLKLSLLQVGDSVSPYLPLSSLSGLLSKGVKEHFESAVKEKKKPKDKMSSQSTDLPSHDLIFSSRGF